jgi:hypothetical protein
MLSLETFQFKLLEMSLQKSSRHLKLASEFLGLFMETCGFEVTEQEILYLLIGKLSFTKSTNSYVQSFDFLVQNSFSFFVGCKFSLQILILLKLGDEFILFIVEKSGVIQETGSLYIFTSIVDLSLEQSIDLMLQ